MFLELQSWLLIRFPQHTLLLGLYYCSSTVLFCVRHSKATTKKNAHQFFLHINCAGSKMRENYFISNKNDNFKKTWINFIVLFVFFVSQQRILYYEYEYEYRREAPYEISVSALVSRRTYPFLYYYWRWIEEPMSSLFLVKAICRRRRETPYKFFLINHEMLKPNDIILEVKSYKVAISYCTTLSFRYSTLNRRTHVFFIFT
jgi:hypothetical protein